MPMLIKPVLAFLAWFGLACLAQASEMGSQLPSFALDPPPPPSWSGLDDMGQFTPYATTGGLAKANASPGVVRASRPANNLVNSSGSPKGAPPPGALDYDLGGNLHMHLSIAGGAMTGGIIRH
jgi:hypothetical protein